MRTRRDPLGAPDLRPDVLVVGGGMLGVTIARACEDAGLGRVLLVESGRLGDGATGGALGLCTPEPHHGVDPDPLVRLGRASLAGWRELEESVPAGVGLVDLEWIGLLDDARAIAARSPHAELLSEAEVAKLVPSLGRPQPGMRVTGQARVNPLSAAARIAAGLRRVATGVRATAVRSAGGAVRSVETTVGTVSPGAVVFATGGPPALAGMAPGPAADVVKGHLVVTVPAPVELPGTVDPVATQLGDGRLILGGTLDPGDDPTVTPVTVGGMLDELGRRVPRLVGLAAERAWCCLRPHHPHHMPVIDRVAGTENAWFTSGHYRTGILMAPATAALMAEWVAAGTRPAAAADFASPR